MSETRAPEMVRRAVALLRMALAAAPPGRLSGADAAALGELYCEAERAAGAGKALCARRVEVTGAYRTLGHRDGAGWLAAVGGEPVGRAKDLLATAEASCRVPTVAAAFAAGELSAPQAKVIAGAAALDPGSAGPLLETARQASFAEVRALAQRTVRRAQGEQRLADQEARAHARRYCRISEPAGGGLRLDALLTKRDGARLKAALEAEVQVLFCESAEPHERLRADALVRLCGRAGGERGGPRAHVAVRVDVGALRRGATEGDETCEIPGVGQVSVAVARELLGDAWFNLVLTDGVDVHCVTSTKRTIPAALRVALAERDPVCVVPGCAVAHNLEIDHWRLDFCRGGRTELDNLARLCGRHHAHKTTLGWRLAGGPGKWRWLPPAVRRT